MAVAFTNREAYVGRRCSDLHGSYQNARLFLRPGSIGRGSGRRVPFDLRLRSTSSSSSPCGR